MTIIGVYDHQEHAHAAKNELLASGFSRGSVQLNPDHELPATRGPSVQSEQHATLNASIGNFFRSLFGMDDKSTYSNVYAEAVRRGAYVLTVDVGSDEQRTRAEKIMGHHGPVDIEGRSAAWIRQGWRGHDPDAPNAAGRLRAVVRRNDGKEQA